MCKKLRHFPVYSILLRHMGHDPWINLIAHQRANQHLDNSVSLWPQNDWSLDPVQQGSKQVCTADQV